MSPRHEGVSWEINGRRERGGEDAGEGGGRESSDMATNIYMCTVYMCDVLWLSRLGDFK